MKYVVDTNFIIRYLLADNKQMFSKTQEVFNKVREGQISLILEQTVFTEIIFVLSSFYQVPKDKIVETLSALLIYKGLECDKELLLLSLDHYKNYNLHIVDCILLAKSQLTSIPILSFDQQLISLNDG